VSPPSCCSRRGSWYSILLSTSGPSSCVFDRSALPLEMHRSFPRLFALRPKSFPRSLSLLRLRSLPLFSRGKKLIAASAHSRQNFFSAFFASFFHTSLFSFSSLLPRSFSSLRSIKQLFNVSTLCAPAYLTMPSNPL